MKNLWEKLNAAAVDVDTHRMAELIIQLLSTTAGSEARFRPLREIIAQDEARFLSFGTDVDTVPMAEMMGSFCRALFAIRHPGQPLAECAELIRTLERAANDVDTMLMARTFERLFHLCESESNEATNQTNLENVRRARERVVAAIGGASWGAVGTSLADMLWSLAEARPDFEELPSLVAEAKESGVFDRHADRGVAVSEKVHSILESVVKRYGDESDRSSIAQMKSGLLRGRSGIPSDELALFSSDVAVRAVQFCKGVQRLPLSMQDDTLHIGRHARISFHRTLRIPEDGRNYPLPAGFGRLPIVRVEDYAERVPEKWLEQGGFIIPLYQREALFLEFAGVKWRPAIAKVSVGRINAISGKEHDLKIRPHRQDYVVIPDQRWLDGINSGNGTVSQFVAMPLGQGYTIEAQVTEEEMHGGFQVAVFDPRAKRFPEADPELVEAALAARATRARATAQAELLNSLPEMIQRVFRALQELHYTDAARLLGINDSQILEFTRVFEWLFSPHGIGGIIPDSNLGERPRLLQLFNLEEKYRHFLDRRIAAIDERQKRMWTVEELMPCPDVAIMSKAPRAEPKPMEMGIAAGGRIKQQIHEDSYGAESWDEEVFRDVVIHIVNSEAYERITGLPAPPCPITVDHYARHKIPWYSDYEENVRAVAPAGVFKRIFPIGQIDKKRGVAPDAPLPKHEIRPDIVRIRTPSVEERFQSLVQRALRSSQNQQYKIAVREASQALDLSREHALPFQIRAQAHLHLGNALDAEADASACLEIEPDNFEALSVRTMASFQLGEYLLARNDAEKILAVNPSAKVALFVREQATLEVSKADKLQFP